MAKSLTANALDAALEYIAARGDLMTLCAGAPEDAADAVALGSSGGKALGSITLTTGVGNGDFTLDDGLSSGRRLIVAAQSAVPIGESGTADHLAIVDTASSELLMVTTLTETQSVSAGEVISVKAFGGEIPQPV